MSWLIEVGVLVLELLFFCGVIGSVLVIVLSGIEDLETLSQGEETGSPPPDTAGT